VGTMAMAHWMKVGVPGVTEGVTLCVPVKEVEAVREGEAVLLGVRVGEGVCVTLTVEVGVGVGEAESDAVVLAVGVGVCEGVALGVGVATHVLTKGTVLTLAPSPTVGS